MAAKSLYEWFAEAAVKYPDAVAIEVPERVLTYSELHHLVDRVATLITRTMDYTPTTIGLLTARSLPAFTGYLAALRLRAVVVPLNPAFPASRNRGMGQAAGVDFVVVGEESGAPEDVVKSLPSSKTPFLRLTTKELDVQLAAPVAEGAAGLAPYVADPDEVAYVVFTSGSTGSPKGVPIVHRGLDAYIRSQIDLYEAGPGSRFSQTFELTFDPSVFDMFVPWGSGGTVVVPSPHEFHSPVDYVNGRGLTHWFSAPSMVSIARRMKALRPGCMPDLKWSRFSGEQLTLQQAAYWREAAPSTVIENVYGPTELTMTCSGYRLPARTEDWPMTVNDTVPIGEVYPYLESVIVDSAGEITLDGELCVRGCQRFPGYLDPQNNIGRFIAYHGNGAASIYDGSKPLDERHWYRTGDRIVVTENGLLHLGRLDDQVKLRGYRVELGEIETVLNRHPSVDQSAAVTVLSEGSITELVAVYVGAPLHPRELVTHIRESLPAYMVPSRFFQFDELPININGKIDRNQIRVDIQERWTC